MDAPDINWPDHIASLEAVRAWIAQRLHAEVSTIRLDDVFQRQAWGVTASFAVDNVGTGRSDSPSARRVVFKSNSLPQRRDMPGLCALLSRICTDSVPVLLASRLATGDDGSAWLLFEHVDGTRIYDIDGEGPGRAAELKLVRTFATIQAAVADVLDGEQVPLP